MCHLACRRRELAIALPHADVLIVIDTSRLVLYFI